MGQDIDNDSNDTGDQNDEVNDNGGEEQQEPAGRTTENVYAELSRKNENIQTELAQTNAKLAALLEQFKPAQQAQPQRNLRDLMYDDPDAYVAEITKRAVDTATQTVENKVQKATATNQVVQDIQSKYAEFSVPGSPAAQLAYKKVQMLPESLRGTPEGARLAMLDAVADLGLVPISANRKKEIVRDTEDFTLGSGAGKSNQQSRNKPADPKKEIDPKTLEFAELMGIDTSDPKRLAGLAEASKRKNWNGYK